MEGKEEKIITSQNDRFTCYTIRKMGMEYKVREDHLYGKAEPYMEECIGLERVAILPDAIRKIFFCSFKQCPNLEKIVLPKDLKRFETRCRTLKEIEVHPQNTNYRAVDGVLFNYNLTALVSYPCGRQGSYEIPEECNYICNDAFSHSEYLNSIRIHQGVRFGYRPFEHCTGLQQVIFDEGADTIPDWLFAGCENIVSITLPLSIKEIGKKAFEKPKEVKEIILPEALLPQQELFKPFSRDVVFISREDGHVLGTPKTLRKQILDVGKMSKAGKSVWALCVTQKAYKQCRLTLNSGKTYAYASRYSVKTGDIAVVGTKLKKSAYLGKSSGQIGKVTEIAQQFTVNRNYMLTLDFAFTKSPTSKVIQNCREILKENPSEFNMSNNTNFFESYVLHPITFLTKKMFAALTLLSFAENLDEVTVDMATQFLKNDPCNGSVMTEIDHVTNTNIKEFEIEFWEGYLPQSEELQKSLQTLLGRNILRKGMYNVENKEVGDEDEEEEEKETHVYSYSRAGKTIAKYISDCVIAGTINILIQTGMDNLLEELLKVRPKLKTQVNKIRALNV